MIADIGTNDLSPPSLDPMTLAEDIVEYLREISELQGVEAVVIFPIMPREISELRRVEAVVIFPIMPREISELRGVEAVMILPITSRSEEFDYNHHVYFLYKYSADLRTLICEKAPSRCRGGEDELRGDREPRKVRHVRNQQVVRFTVPLPVSPRLTLAGDFALSDAATGSNISAKRYVRHNELQCS